MGKEHEIEEPVAIPVEALSSSALEGVIRDYILREGTDYGDYEYSLEQKVEVVRHQLQSGKAQIMYDAVSESCTIMLC